jgi:hypothetical protein
MGKKNKTKTGRECSCFSVFFFKKKKGIEPRIREKYSKIVDI